ncbi:MAG TPA: right-handed parallel beta-helix repeat-containing protein [Longimicrobium sp.]|nr:right-handed parallel beta-helix repeat-containing protein [Longimicrobium sp.]
MTSFQGVLIDEGGAFYNVKAGGAVGDTRVLQGGAIAAGSTLLTVDGGTFTAQDVGKVVSVAGAGAPVPDEETIWGITIRPPRNNLGSVVQGFVSATQVELRDAAQSTVAGAAVTWGTDDTAAIQAALDGNAQVYLPPGRYTLTAPLRVTRGGVALRGAGSGVSVLTGSVGLSMLLSLSSFTNSVIEGLEVAGVGLDGAPDRLKTYGIEVVSARRVTVREVAGASLEGFVGFDFAFDWALTGFSTVDTLDTVSVSESGEGTIADGRILRANEGLDFYGASDVTVSNVLITSHGPGEHPGIYQGAIDFSSSRRVTFSGLVVRGDFMYAVHLKQEMDPAPAVQDIVFTGCQFHDFRQYGFYLTAGLPSPPGEAGVPNRGLRLDGCTVRSAAASAAGVYISYHAPNDFREVVITGCTIDAPTQAVRNTDYDGLVIRDSILRAGGGNPAVYVEGVDGVLLDGCRVEGGSGNGLELRAVKNPRVERCTVTAGGTAMVLLDCRRPVVRGNEVPACTFSGIYLLWNGAAGMAADAAAGAMIDQNVVRDWGTGDVGRGAIEVRFNGVTGTCHALSVSGNSLVLDAPGTATQGQVGILFSKGELTAIAGARVDENLIYGPPTAVQDAPEPEGGGEAG